MNACDECKGTGFSVQGWTDKNGEPEDQYGPCRCRAAVTAARTHPHHTNQAGDTDE